MKKWLISIGLVAAVVGALVLAPAVGAEQFNPCNAGTTSLCGSGTPTDAGSVVKSIIQVLLWIVGIVAVIMVIFGGIQYAASAGGEGVKKAKNTITYAIVGLVVAIFAYAIVSWVFDQFVIRKNGPAIIVQQVK